MAQAAEQPALDDQHRLFNFPLSPTACGPSSCDAGRASGSACGRHPASAPCKPSQADTSVSAWTVPSRCRPKTPNTISGTAGPNSQMDNRGRGLTGMSPHQSVPVCTARRWYRRFRRARRRFKADRHQRAPMLRRGEARLQDYGALTKRRFPYGGTERDATGRAARRWQLRRCM